MTALLTLLSLYFAQPDAEPKVSLRLDPAKPIADAKIPFVVLATVKDGQGRPVAGATVRFTAHGYMKAPDGTIIGCQDAMKRGIDYKVIVGGGMLSTDQKAVPSNLVDATTDQDGVARVNYRPWNWAGFMERVPTRVTASYIVAGTIQTGGALDISFTKPKN